MRHLLTASLLYAALLAEVALGEGALGEWTPCLVLLAVLGAARQTGGLAWAFLGGLACDSLSGRPLGVTSLVATLTVTALRILRPQDVRPPGRVIEVFVAVALIDAAARAFATVGAERSHLSAELFQAIQSAAATALTLATGLLLHRLADAVARLATGRIAPAVGPTRL